jgi:hypothetical protein
MTDTLLQIGLELLEVANRISPGISRLRGVILYELQATLAAYARRKFSAGEISAEHMRNIMKVQYTRLSALLAETI